MVGSLLFVIYVNDLDVGGKINIFTDGIKMNTIINSVEGSLRLERDIDVGAMG